MLPDSWRNTVMGTQLCWEILVYNAQASGNAEMVM